MRKIWEKPVPIVDKFEANEYIAACYTLVCAIPGRSADEIGDGTSARWFEKDKNWGGQWVQADNLDHGNCGNESTSYDIDHSVGYEHNDDGTVKNAVILNINVMSQTNGQGFNYATWQSDNGTLYTHYGFAIPNDNPNHS